MNDSMRHDLITYRDEIEARYNAEQRRMRMLAGYDGKRLKLTHDKYGHDYYSVLLPGEDRYRYLGKGDEPEVVKIKEAHYLRQSAKELKAELDLADRFLGRSRSIGYEDIDSKLRKAYRGAPVPSLYAKSKDASEWLQEMERYKAGFSPFRTHELIHRTHDGTMVRSLGEALIYNYLLEFGVTFVYELPLKIRDGSRDSLLLPDFSILADVEISRVIYIEHQGMMNDLKYRNKFNDTVYKYWSNGYLPERDVFFTFNSPNGGFDDTPIRKILQGNVRILSKE